MCGWMDGLASMGDARHSGLPSGERREVPWLVAWRESALAPTSSV